MEFKTSYNECVTVFKAYPLGLDGSATLKDIKLANKAIRRMKAEMIDLETAFEAKNTKLNEKYGKDGNPREKALELEELKKEVNNITKEVNITLDIPDDCLKKLADILGKLTVAKLEKSSEESLESNTLLMLDEFIDRITISKVKK